ncbi:MAG: SRPBCC domain-containing protein [Rhodoferax sp.]|nr:SRPBCC domain-containing protein [Rhodoferax sp.]MDP3655039.1 SRPBCC domain-containing protein [Rhodoferax sp.]
MYTLSTTTFTEQGGNKTLLTLEWSAFEATAEEAAAFDAAHASMNQGWSGNLDALENYLSLLQTA